MKFVPDKRPLLGRGGNQPPQWVTVAVGAVIGCVVLVLMSGQQERGSWLRSAVPYGDTNWFWVGFVVLPLAAVVGIAILSYRIEMHRAASWTKTMGRIVRSDIETRRRQFQGEPEKVENVPAIEYEFDAGGRTVRGSRVSIADDPGGEHTAETLERYPVGATVAVYYDPADPRNCTLERDASKDLTAAGCLAALAICALFACVAYAFIAHGPAFVRAYFPKHGNAEFAVFATGFGLFALLFFFAFRRYSQQAAAWPTVSGQVVRSDVEMFRTTEKGRTSTSYRPVVEYVYSVRGREYRSNQITLMVQTSGSERFAEKIRAKYTAGTKVTVRYDPANPGNAALETPGGAVWFPLAIAAVCFGLAAWQAGLFW